MRLGTVTLRPPSRSSSHFALTIVMPITSPLSSSRDGVTLGGGERVRRRLLLAAAQIEHVAVGVVGDVIELVLADVNAAHPLKPTPRGSFDCGKAVTT